MPAVIYNMQTGVSIPDIAENRIKTFRDECGGDYRKHKLIYKTVRYGLISGNSHPLEIKEAGFYKEHCFATLNAHGEATRNLLIELDALQQDLANVKHETSIWLLKNEIEEIKEHIQSSMKSEKYWQKELENANN